jgi:hypothetical protein
VGPLLSAATQTPTTLPGLSWPQLIGVLLGSGVVSALVSSWSTSLRSSAEHRRDGYAAAVEAVVAWSEYPYRIRRRTSDDPAALDKLAALGHDLQERRARTLAWVAGENRAVYAMFLANVRCLDQVVGPLAAEAWAAAPVIQPNSMVLNGWGPGPVAQDTVRRLNCLITYRFGWRRFIGVAPWLLRRIVARFRPPPP